MGRFLNLLKPIARIMPEVRAPGRKVSFNEKLIWTGLVLVVYLVMGQIPLYGITTSGQTDPFQFMRIIFASSRGSLMELGIGPIVTAGLILQLLAGAKIISVDFSNSEERGLFTSASKLFSIVMTIFNASAYLLGGAYGTVTVEIAVLIFVQLIIVGILVMLMDELVQKGWGIGSGISLFIAAGVAQSIWWESLAPIGPMSDGKLYGSFIALGESILKGEGLWSIIHRSGGLPDMIGFMTTIAIFLVVIYLEGVRVELPLAYAKYRGYRSRFPVKFLYVSNIPVILASALFANIYFFSELIWYNFNRNNDNFWLNLIGTFNATASTPQPLGGLAYYTTPPRDIAILVTDPLRAIIFVMILIGLSVLFALTWLQVGGLDSRTVAKQLMDAGMQIPGFRRSEQQIKTILDRYIPAVTVLGGGAVGAIAALGDLTNVYGSGTGILLLVGILYQYYQSLAKERMAEMHPAIRQFLGE